MSRVDAKVGNMRWWRAGFSKLPPDYQLEIRARVFGLVLEARKRALQELIADAVGFQLFGISAVFATEDLVAGDAWDAPPEEESRFYPPWRYRIRQLPIGKSERKDT